LDCQWFIDHLTFEIDCRKSIEGCFLIDLQETPSAVDLVGRGNECSVCESNLTGMNTKLARVTNRSGLRAFSDEPIIISKVGHYLIEKR
jgi:hypothetical protein